MLDLTQFDGHTPGPWWYDDYGTYIFTKKNNQMVGETRGTGANLPQDINGRLLASSPELLAEVRRLEKTLNLIRAGARLSLKMSSTINGQELINIIDEALK